MSQKRCKFCNAIIIKDWERWLEENKETFWIMCPICFEMEKKEDAN